MSAALWAARSRSAAGTAVAALLLAPAIVLGFSLLYLLAAMALGSPPPWQTLRRVTLPLIRLGIFAGALFAILISLDNPSLSFFGSTSTNTLPVVMLSYMQNQFDPSIAAISMVQMPIAVTTLLVVKAFYGIEKFTAA